MNQRRWGLLLGGIKSSLEIVCFQVVPERVKCIGWTDRVRKGIPNRWCSSMKGARTKNKVSVRYLQELRRKRWPENTGWTVRSKKASEIRWNFIVCGLESERGKLKFYMPLNWQPVEFSKWFCAGQPRHQRRHSYSPGKENKDQLARPAQNLNRCAPGRPAQNISVCSGVGVLRRRWVTFSEYLTVKGHCRPTNVGIRKLEWLPFCVVSKYLQFFI